MVSVLTGAHEALKIAREVTGKNNISQQEGQLRGRRVKHWSYYLLLAGAVAGAIAGIIGAIISMTPLTVMGSILFVTNAVGAYYVRKFDTFNDLEDYVSVMSNSIKEMAGYIKKLKSINKELRGIGDDFEDNLEETTQVWEHGYDQIRKEAKEIEKLTKRLETTTKKLKKMEVLYSNLQDAVNIFSNNVGDLSQGANDIDDKVGQLANQVTDSKAVLEQMDEENEEFDENNELYEQLNRANIDFLDSFQKELQKIVNMHDDAIKLRDTFDEKEKSLRKIADTISTALKTIAELQKQEDKAKDKNSRLLEQADRLTEAMQQVTANIASLQEKNQHHSQ
jgi:methyl-accepting chemotaxis protein